MSKKYYCSCVALCKGRRREVSRSTFQRHSLHRPKPNSTPQFSTNFQQYISSAGAVPTRRSSNLPNLTTVPAEGSTSTLTGPTVFGRSDDLIPKRRRVMDQMERDSFERPMELLTDVCKPILVTETIKTYMFVH